MSGSPPKIDDCVVPDVDERSLGSGDSSDDDADVDDELGGSTSRHDCGQSSSAGSSMEREMNEIESLAREDTNMLRVWRRVVTVIMLCTFAAVLTGAIVFLKNAENESSHDEVIQIMFKNFPVTPLTLCTHCCVAYIECSTFYLRRPREIRCNEKLKIM